MAVGPSWDQERSQAPQNATHRPNASPTTVSIFVTWFGGYNGSPRRKLQACSGSLVSAHTFDCLGILSDLQDVACLDSLDRLNCFGCLGRFFGWVGLFGLFFG